MQIKIQPFTVNKKVPLKISRGTTSQSTNIWLRIEADGIEGWGEATPFSIGTQQQTTAEIMTALNELIPTLQKFHPLDRQSIDRTLRDSVWQRLPSAVVAAIDLALHDWLGKKAKLPLWQIWGLDPQKSVPISVTVGINSPAGAQDRIRKWQEIFDCQFFKLKLGSPEGIAADQAMFAAVQEIVPQAKFSVDANGGWSLADAISMTEWLKERGVAYVEQPLARGSEADLLALSKASALPIFVDESFFVSEDLPKLVESFAGASGDRMAGINIKLMKCGGLSEARRSIHAARTWGLQVMIGCYSDSCLSNTAAAHLGPLVDHLDLDSHLNLLEDPFVGATIQQGRLIPSNLPGLGVELKPR
jgi:L-Ala-D/L-Glu epimerase